MEAVAEDQFSVLLSSHVVSDLERVCDHVVVLVDSQIRVAGDVEELRRDAPPARRAAPRPGPLPADQQVIAASHTDRQTTLVVRTAVADPGPGMVGQPPRTGGSRARLHVDGRRRAAAGPPTGDAAVIWLSWRQLRAQAAAPPPPSSRWPWWPCSPARDSPPLPAPASRCSTGSRPTTRTLFYAGIVLMALAPALLGAFLGAPLVARELETGTYRLAWSQSVTRRRWLASRLALTVGVAGLTVAAASLAVTWWSAPLDGAVSQTRGALPDRLTPVAFAMRGVVPVGYAAFAVVLGATAGAVLRRTLPAMAVTLALYVAIQIVVPMWVRPHLLAPVTSTLSFSRSTLDGISLDGPGRVSVSVHTAGRGDWVLVNETLGPDRTAARPPQWFADCLPGPAAPASDTQRAEVGSIDECLTRLTQAGYRQRVVYQPAEPVLAAAVGGDGPVPVCFRRPGRRLSLVGPAPPHLTRLRGRSHRHTSAAIATTWRSLAHCSSSVMTLPCTVLANPHCGLRHS